MTSNALPRSPELMNAHDTALLVVDVQQRIVPAIQRSAMIEWNIRRLLDGAATLGVATAATEQYPERLGPTLPQLAERLEGAASKLRFSCAECGDLFRDWLEGDRHRVLLSGIETHVCVQQTAYDLMAAGFQVYVATDAVGSRFDADYRTALRRLESAGATLTTTEAALFEWCEVAGSPEFKKISALAKESAPIG